MWRVLRIAGLVLLGLVILAIAREGWQQGLLALLGIGFIWLILTTIEEM